LQTRIGATESISLGVRMKGMGPLQATGRQIMKEMIAGTH